MFFNTFLGVVFFLSFSFFQPSQAGVRDTLNSATNKVTSTVKKGVETVVSSLPKKELLLRQGKSCTGTCDQPSQVCTGNQELVDWCKKYCGHKINVEEICKTATATVGQKAACSKSESDRIMTRANAAVAARFAYDYGEKGGYNKGDFSEINHLNSATTGLVAWAGIKDCVLYVAYRGTVNKRDVLKDAQIGVATIADKVGLGDFASRGEYNNAVLEGIKFYEETIKKAGNLFSHVVITGHSLGGGFAQNVGDKVARGQSNLEVISLNAPGTDFKTNKAGEGHEDVQAEHLRREGDVVSLWGTHTEGTKGSTGGGSKNPLTAHYSNEIVKDFERRQQEK